MATPSSRRKAAKKRLAAAAAAESSAAYPRWVALEFICNMENKYDSSSVFSFDAATLAAARTSNGHPIKVSLLLDAPPATSRVCLQLPSDFYPTQYVVIAAHRDSVLIEVGYNHYHTRDHFVFNVGAAAAEPSRPPSLSLLPRFPHPRPLKHDGTGLLRRSENEIVVAELMMLTVSQNQHTPVEKVAQLLMLRSGEWSLNRPSITREDGGDCRDLSAVWESNTVIVVDDRLLCWVDLCLGLMFCDVFEESPRLRYVPLPSDHCFGRASNRNVCVTAGGKALKFVNIFPRCCCGGAGSCKCEHCHNAYTIRTWTLSTDDMSPWVMDSMVDSTELRAAFSCYKDLPCIQPAYPDVSMDEPHVICFRLSKMFHNKHDDNAMWLIMVDMKKKTLLSVLPYPAGARQMTFRVLLLSRLSCYLNSYQNSCSDGTSDGLNKDTESSLAVVNKDTARDSMQQFSAETTVESSEIFAALQEIPRYGLSRDDMLKAYSILSDENGRCFRSLLGLPTSLRKDWLLMQIKNSET